MATKPQARTRRCASGAVTPHDADGVYALWGRAHARPEPGPAADALAEEIAEQRSWWVDGEWRVDDRPEPRRYLLHLALGDGGGVAALAESFVRAIRTDRGELTVLALAGVVSDPLVRGRGFGKAVIRDAFARLGDDPEGRGEPPTHCLFQTGDARGLYEKLGAVIVTNRFVDRTASDPEANPWDDDWVMRYPATADWPAGVIDLNGPGY